MLNGIEKKGMSLLVCARFLPSITITYNCAHGCVLSFHAIFVFFFIVVVCLKIDNKVNLLFIWPIRSLKRKMNHILSGCFFSLFIIFDFDLEFCTRNFPLIYTGWPCLFGRIFKWSTWNWLKWPLENVMR